MRAACVQVRDAMKVGDCPSCRAPVEFSAGSARIKVCEYCNTVIARDGGNLGALGKVSDLLDTESPLKVGLSGRYGGTPLTVMGRVQKTRGDASWDEWYLAFEDGREAWLAESEGDWKLLFPVAEHPAYELGAFRPLNRFSLRDTEFVVEEVGDARTTSAQGELPAFNRSHVYVDATGPRGMFCTLDWDRDDANEPVEVFVGNLVTLGQLGFDPSELAPTPRRTALAAARCTQCNGPLDLKAPDAAKRVACPYCNALLDVSHGNLRFLEQLQKPDHEPLIPLGSVGKLREPGADAKSPPTSWTCIAFLVRSCEVESVTYPWDEYLLWNREKGFRWLMRANGHWTWLEPIAAGTCSFSHRSAKRGDEAFRQFQSVYVTTDHVVGECYWEVNAGDVAVADEYVAPPRSLNVDRTDNEVTVTLGTLLEAEVVRDAFVIKAPLSQPSGIAPAQVNKRRVQAGEAWTWAAVWSGALLALALLFSILGTTETYWSGDFSVPPGVTPASPEAQRFSEPFEVKEKVPLAVEVRADALVNNWLGVSVDLVNEKTGEVIEVYAEPSYYSGGSGEDAWSEGSRDATKRTDVVDKGSYVVRVTPHFEPGRAVGYAVTVRADDGVGLCPFLLIVVLLAWPLFLSISASSFETQKWNDAVFQSAPGVSTFPYAKDDDDE